MKRKEIPNMNQSVTVRTFSKEGQTFLIELRNWIWASQFSSFTAHVCYNIWHFMSQITFFCFFFLTFSPYLVCSCHPWWFMWTSLSCCISTRSPCPKWRLSQKEENLDKFEEYVKELPWGKPNLWKSFRSINHPAPQWGNSSNFFPTSSSFMIGLLPRLKNFLEEKSSKKLPSKICLTNVGNLSHSNMLEESEILLSSLVHGRWAGECPIRHNPLPPTSSVHTK